MGKVKETMKQIGIQNRLKTSEDNAQACLRWMMKYHPEILDEYVASQFFKILMRTNQYSSVMEAHHFLDTGKEE